jgi:hypothetical protein
MTSEDLAMLREWMILWMEDEERNSFPERGDAHIITEY